MKTLLSLAAVLGFSVCASLVTAIASPAESASPKTAETAPSKPVEKQREPQKTLPIRAHLWLT